MAKNIKALIAMLGCIGLIAMVPGCRDKDKDNGYRRDKKETKQKHVKKEKKTVRQDNNRPNTKKMKTVESVETSSSY